MELTGPARSFSSARSFEEICSLLYTVGFRLNGDHQEAASLVLGCSSYISSVTFVLRKPSIWLNT